MRGRASVCIPRVLALVAVALLGACLAAQPAAAQANRAGTDKAATSGASAGAPAPPKRFDARLNFDSFCLEEEKKATVQSAEAQLDQTNKVADAARAYLQTMRQRIAAESEAGRKGNRSAAEAAERDQAALSAFEKDLLHAMTVDDPKFAEDQLERAINARVIDCTKPQSHTGRRPDFAPVEIPPVPEKLCTQAEIDALRSAAEAAEKLAAENRDKAEQYWWTIYRQLKYYQDILIDKATLVYVPVKDREKYKEIAAELDIQFRRADRMRETQREILDKASKAGAGARALKPTPCEPPPAPRKPEADPKPAEPAKRHSSLPEQIRNRINGIRGEPVEYAADLQAFKNRFKGNVAYTSSRPRGVVTVEGVAAVDDAILYVGKQPPRAPLEYSPVLTAVAQALVNEQGPRGTTGHMFADGTGPADRSKRAGGDSFVSESIGYGSGGADEIVLRLIVDDGVPGRGHRKMLLSQEYRYVGIACGPHAVYGQMCVIDFSATPDGSPMLPGGATPPPPPPPP